jgi:hypothetical protein
MRLAKVKTITLLPCVVVLIALGTNAINGQKKADDVGDRIAVLYPDDAALSAKILAKYMNLKHILPYYALFAEQKQYEAAKRRLELAKEEALYAKRDLVDSLLGRPVIAAGVIESTEQQQNPEQKKQNEAGPDAEHVGPPAPDVSPDRVPPRQITIHPYRLDESAPQIANYFTKEELIKNWPK